MVEKPAGGRLCGPLSRTRGGHCQVGRTGAGRLTPVNARSALFDLYGDHLRSRGGRAPVAALVRLLAPVGVAAPAVRTAISRMVRQDWLTPVRIAGTPGYELTPRAALRVDEAARRIYRLRRNRWDGSWHVAVPAHVAERTARDRLRAGLSFLGYGQLGHDTWVSPRASDELDALLATEGVIADTFTARHLGDPCGLVRRAWDLDALALAYARWLEDARDLVAAADPPPHDEDAFAVRSRLVHEWRKFLFTDPMLPRKLLPESWPGDDAAAFFDAHATRLLPAANRFVDTTLATPV